MKLDVLLRAPAKLGSRAQLFALLAEKFASAQEVFRIPNFTLVLLHQHVPHFPNWQVRAVRCMTNPLPTRLTCQNERCER